MAVCWSCRKEYETPDLVTRESECPHCAAFLRCCRNCEFYDVTARNMCREPQAELQAEKEIANACDYFRPAKSVRGEGQSKKTKSDFDSLFKE